MKLESERNASVQNRYQQFQQYQLKQQRQRQQRGYHSQNLSEDHYPTAFSVPIQRPRHHSSAEVPTAIGRPAPTPIQRPTPSDLASSNLSYSVSNSSIWAQRPIQPQSNSHQPQAPSRPLPTTTTTTTQPVYSPQLHQLHNPRSLSFHNSMVAPSTGSNLIRRSSLKNPTSFNSNTTPSSGSGSNTPVSSSRSVTSSPAKSHASIVASSSTLSSKAPVFEPTRSISVISKLTGGNPNANVTMANLNVNTNLNTSPLMSKGKASSSRASTVPAPIQRPVARASSGDSRSSGGGH